MPPKPMTHKNADAALEKELNALKTDYDRLRDDKVRTEQDLAHLQKQLADLERRALEEYGTADPGALEKLLAEKRAENERLVGEYREHIRSVRQGLERVEREFED